MREPYCEKEQQVVAARRCNSRNSEILAHARNCTVCSEVLLVTEFLREETNLAQRELGTLRDATLIWRRAQVLARQKVLIRATLPIRMARISALVVALFGTLWLILESHQPRTWTTDLWPRVLSSANRFWPSDLNQPVLLLALTGTLICIGLSSWYMLRED